jgi:hypothetical protein
MRGNIRCRGEPIRSNHLRRFIVVDGLPAPNDYSGRLGSGPPAYVSHRYGDDSGLLRSPRNLDT